ncbi:hypothetical protein [Actinopolymorpha sp. B9G3]|uniref:hypothetical protein n=1 Tax=Actinopolymorpha sp. B9G3 TaxID=3158970 RepID=UPI0032D991F7
MRGPGLPPDKHIQARVWARRAAAISVGAAVVSALTVAPAAASDEVSAEGETVSQATASAFNLSMAGQVAGSGGFVAVNDGVLETVKGVRTPDLPVIDDQQAVVVGALGQDAAATASGYAAACAGVVGSAGVIKVGSDNTCLISGEGSMQVSLGTLDQLGLAALLGGQLPGLPALPDLPATGDLPLPTSLPETGNPPVPGNLPAPGDLPVPAVPDLALTDLGLADLGLEGLTGELALPAGGLPDIELMLVGEAITSRCLSTPTDTFGEATPIDAQVVAVVAGQQVPVADLTADGLDLTLADILSKVQSQLPAQAGTVVDQILAAVPADQLNAVQLATIQVGAQTADATAIAVTALGVETALPGLIDIELGKVTCTSNASASADADADVQAGTSAGGLDAGAGASADESGVAAGGGAAAEAGPAQAEGAVSANLATASDNNPAAKLGWGAVIALLLAGVGLAGLKLRSVIRH